METTRRRIWSGNGGTVLLRETDPMGDDEIIREFWVPAGGGYGREIDARHPGTLGRQVCTNLAHTGSTLSATPDSLFHVIRREYRRAGAVERRLQQAR